MATNTPTQEELLAVWNKVQEAKKRKSEYYQTEQGKAYNCEKAKKYYDAHKDEVLQKRRAYYLANKDRMNEYQREYAKKRRAECKKKDVPAGQMNVLEFVDV